jgi:AhpD family alkylhydroperoxidase
MPRIPLREAHEVGPVLRLMYRFARKRLGKMPEPFMAYAHSPRFVMAAGVHEMLVQRAARRLNAELRELVVHRVATVVGCEWCVDFGTMLAISAGFSVERHRELARYRDSDAFTADEKLALEYADAMTAQPMTVDDDLVERLRGAFDDGQLVELTYMISVENLRARANHALGITSQGYTRGDACPLPYREQITAAQAGRATGPRAERA